RSPRPVWTTTERSCSAPTGSATALRRSRRSSRCARRRVRCAGGAGGGLIEPAPSSKGVFVAGLSVSAGGVLSDNRGGLSAGRWVAARAAAATAASTAKPAAVATASCPPPGARWPVLATAPNAPHGWDVLVTTPLRSAP